MAELGASTGKWRPMFSGVPHPCSHLGSTRFGTSWAQTHCRAPGEGGGSKLPSRESQCSPLRLHTVLLRCAVASAGQRAANLMDCRPLWGAGLCNHGDTARTHMVWQDSPLRDQPSLRLYLGLEPMRKSVALVQPGQWKHPAHLLHHTKRPESTTDAAW